MIHVEVGSMPRPCIEEVRDMTVELFVVGQRDVCGIKG